MTSGLKLRFAVSTAALLAGSLPAGLAVAQNIPSNVTADTSADPSKAGETNSLADIVVTAQRRSESLQKTSVVVDVVSSQALARAGVTDPKGLASILPSVQIANVGPVLQVYIRGVGDYGTNATSNPAIAFNIDGVYVARSQSIASEFYDVDRVEVLKGPQGTLYGRNASGGAVNLLTRRPELGRFTANLSGEYANYEGRSIDGAINVPISATLAARVSGTYVDKDGYTTEGYSDDKHESARAKLLWQPSSATSLLLNGSYGHIGGRGGAFSVLVNKVPGLVDQSPWLDTTDPRARPFLISRVSPLVRQIPGTLDPARPEEGFQNLRFWNASAELNTDLGFATLTVLPAYRYARMFYNTETFLRLNTGQGFGSFPDSPSTSEETTVETRLSHNDDKLKWVVGGYFFNENQHEQYVNGDVTAQKSARIFKLDTRSYAAFGQATYSILDDVRIIGGIRYTSDRRALVDGTTYALAPGFKCPGTLGTICVSERYAGRLKSSNVSWKAGLEADVTPDSLFFATASTGFKVGGFNPSISPVAPVGSNAAYAYKPEKLLAFETGLKSRFLNNRVQLNVEGFYWKYKDLQQARVAVSGAGNTGLSLDNAGKARMYGGSADLLAKPWKGGTFSANLEYLNARYDTFAVNQPTRTILPGSVGCPVRPSSLPPGAAGPLSTIDCSGFQVTRSPKWSGSAGYTHRFDLANGGAIETQGTLRFASSRWIATDFVPVERAPNYQTLEASISYNAPGDKYSITGFVRNITNAVVYQGGFEGPQQPGVVAATILPPRTYGVRLAVRY